jgi:hypothetical protein
VTGSGALDLGGVNLKIDRHLNALAAEIDAFVVTRRTSDLSRG